MEYIVAGLAGIAIGATAMRAWPQLRKPSAGEAGSGTQSKDEESRTAAVAPPTAPLRGARWTLLAAGAIAATAIGLFALRSPGEATSPVALPATPPAGKGLADVDTMIASLAARLEKDPADGEGFRMLGWSYVMTGRPENAIAPYKRALALLPGKAVVHSGYAEALTGVAHDTVTPEAKAEFERALALDPGEPRARYFLALWQAQHGQERAALDKWVALANGGPADAPWQNDVRRAIDRVSTKLGIDVTSRLKLPPPPQTGAAPMAGGNARSLDAVQMQAALALADAGPQHQVDGMVERLAQRLAASPADPDGWVQLLRSRMVLEQRAQARDDLAAARKALAGDAAGLGKVDAAASRLGVPGA